MVFGVFIEVVQAQIPGRTGEWPDLLADALGIAAGLALAAALTRSGLTP
jgi:VanZ family protein